MPRLTALVLSAGLVACGGRFEGLGPCGDACAEIAPAPRLARLTHAQWEQTVADLLLLPEPPALAGTFIGDGLSDGFDNDATRLQIGPELWQDYQRAAELLARRVVEDHDLYVVNVPQDPRSPDAGIDFEDVVLGNNAARVTATTGAPSGTAYNIWTNGSLYVNYMLPQAGNYDLVVSAWASRCQTDLALMEVKANGNLVLTTEVSAQTSSAAQDFVIPLNVAAGPLGVEVSFMNDCYVNGEDRNLIVTQIAVYGGEGGLGTSQATEADAVAWIDAFGRRAHRRPLSDEDRKGYLALWRKGSELVASGDDFADGVRVVVQAMLQSPFFLYRTELSVAQDDGGRISLDGYEVANRLSYAMWGTMPDDALFAAAASGELATEAGVRAQAERLIQHPRARQIVRGLHAELLNTQAWANINKDPVLFPAYRPTMNASMQEEPLRFAEDVVLDSRTGVFSLFTAPYTFVDAEIAGLYGAQVEPGAGFVRVDLDPAQRSGLLTQVGFLAYEADAYEASIIHRGVYISRKVLCANLPPPPDVIAPLPGPQEGLTNRERVDQHTGDGTCGAGCHSVIINPPGFALENYDAMGIWRTTDAGKPVNASGAYPTADGMVSWSGPVDFTANIADSLDVHRCYVSHWHKWLHGRGIDERDKARLERLGAASRGNDRPIRELILDILADDGFRYRAPSLEAE